MLGSSPALLTKILAGEDASLELKEVVFAGDVVKGPTRDGLVDEIAAFANARGGLLALGVDDTSKEILGIPLRKLDFVEQLAREVCHDAIDPPVDATILKVRLADSSGLPQWTLVVEIDRSLAVHRSPGGYVRRLGSSKRKMSQEQLARLFRQRSYARLIRFDETAVPGTSLAHLGTALFDRFRTGRTADTRATVARKLGMAAREDGGAMTLTVGGGLLGTAQPEQWLRHAFIQATAYRGTSIAEALDATNYQIDAKDICGPQTSRSRQPLSKITCQDPEVLAVDKSQFVWLDRGASPCVAAVRPTSFQAERSGPALRGTRSAKRPRPPTGPQAG